VGANAQDGIQIFHAVAGAAGFVIAPEALREARDRESPPRRRSKASTCVQGVIFQGIIVQGISRSQSRASSDQVRQSDWSSAG
jgi:hypothetical protein